MPPLQVKKCISCFPFLNVEITKKDQDKVFFLLYHMVKLCVSTFKLTS